MAARQRRAPGPRGAVHAGAFVTRMVHDYEQSARFAEAAERAGGGWQATLARAEALSGGDAGRGRHLLSMLAAPGCEPEWYSAAARARAEQAFWRQGAAVTKGAGHAGAGGRAGGPPASSSLISEEARLALVALEVDDSIRLATEAVAVADTLMDRLHGITCAALATAFQGRTRVALDMLRMVAEPAMASVADDATPAGYLAFTYSFALVNDGRIGTATRLFDAALDRDLLRRGEPSQALPAFWLARAMVAEGRLATAVALCADALASLGGENHFGRGTWIANTLAVAAAQAGDSETAADALAWSDERTRPEATTAASSPTSPRPWLAASWARSPRPQHAHDAAARSARRRAFTVELVAAARRVRLGAAATVVDRLHELATIGEGPYAPTSDAAFAERRPTATAGRSTTCPVLTMDAHLLAPRRRWWPPRPTGPPGVARAGGGHGRRQRCAAQVRGRRPPASDPARTWLAGRPPDRPRARGGGAGRPRPVQPRDRGRAGHLGAHGRQPPQPRLRQARDQRPVRPGRGAGPTGRGARSVATTDDSGGRPWFDLPVELRRTGTVPAAVEISGHPAESVNGTIGPSTRSVSEPTTSDGAAGGAGARSPRRRSLPSFRPAMCGGPARTRLEFVAALAAGFRLRAGAAQRHTADATAYPARRSPLRGEFSFCSTATVQRAAHSHSGRGHAVAVRDLGAGSPPVEARSRDRVGDTVARGRPFARRMLVDAGLMLGRPWVGAHRPGAGDDDGWPAQSTVGRRNRTACRAGRRPARCRRPARRDQPSSPTP